MHMRVTWGRIKPGKWDEYEALWREYAKRTAGSKGLKQRYLLRDNDTPDAGYSISLWESAADFEAHMASRVAPAEMEQCFVGQYVVNVCDLRGAEPAVPGA